MKCSKFTPNIHGMKIISIIRSLGIKKTIEARDKLAAACNMANTTPNITLYSWATVIKPSRIGKQERLTGL